MKRTAITLFALAITAAAFAAPQRGGGPHAGPHGRGPGAGPGPALAEYLDLTDAQHEQARAIRESAREAARPIQEQLRGVREQVRTAAEAGDAKKAGELVVAAHGLREQLRANREAADAKFAAILTAEQKAKWEAFQELRDLRRQRGGRRGPR